VTIFDIDIPPGIAFIRSLARAGVPVVACSSKRFAAGRFSRYVNSTRTCPSVHDSDRFIAWLVDEMASGTIDLVAPTSDYVTFCVAEAIEKLDLDPHDLGFPSVEKLRTCLFKGRFMGTLDALGFPAPPTATPLTVEEALVAADEIGYPVVLKPRSHVGIGTHRGLVVTNPYSLKRAFRPYKLGDAHAAALRHVPDLSMPLVQRYHPMGTVDVVSVSGCLDRDGAVLALGHSRKISQAPRRFGVGTMFEPVPPQPFTDAAVDAVRTVLGSGLFELELLVERRSGMHQAIDLNARAFGQIALDIALGNDLPRIWYESVTGSPLRSPMPQRRPPAFWHDAVSSYAGLGVRLLRGPDRPAILRHALGRFNAPRVEAAFDVRDPVPGVLFALLHLRHPRSFIRQFFVDIELTPPSARAMAPGDDGRPWADHSL
jgi:predicted ATP-grasp superfamily ATP-dependent carboligase